MDRSTGRNPVESVSTDEVSAADPIDGRMPTIDFFPAEVVRHRTARWRGVRAKTMQIINHEPFEYRFKQQYHLLIAVEQGVCYDAETIIEGLPISTVRNCSHRLMFVPAGRMFFGAQRPLGGGALASGAARFGGIERGRRTSNAGRWLGSHVGPKPLALKR